MPSEHWLPDGAAAAWLACRGAEAPAPPVACWVCAGACLGALAGCIAGCCRGSLAGVLPRCCSCCSCWRTAMGEGDTSMGVQPCLPPPGASARPPRQGTVFVASENTAASPLKQLPADEPLEAARSALNWLAVEASWLLARLGLPGLPCGRAGGEAAAPAEGCAGRPLLGSCRPEAARSRAAAVAACICCCRKAICCLCLSSSSPMQRRRASHATWSACEEACRGKGGGLC